MTHHQHEYVARAKMSEIERNAADPRSADGPRGASGPLVASPPVAHTMTAVADLRSRTAESPAHDVAAALPGGCVVRLRPLRHGESAPLTAVFDGMSAEAREQRYLTGLRHLPGPMVTALTDVDGHRHVAWVAVLGGRPVGIARYVLEEPGVAEIAFEVVDAHHGAGIGSVLLDAVTTVAAARGVRRLRALVHPGNRPSLRLLGRVGVQLSVVGGLLEGEGPLRLLDPPRVDRTAVVALARSAAWRIRPEVVG